MTPTIILHALSANRQHKLLDVSLYNFRFIIEYSASEGQSIRCFECNSNTDPRCAEKMVPAYLSVDCSKTPEAQKGIKHTICRKTLQFVEIPVNGSKCKRRQRKYPHPIYSLSFFIVTVKGEERVIRSCGWVDSKYTNNCYAKSGFGGRQDVCSCTSDYCNGSTTIGSSAVAAAICLSIATIFSYFLTRK